MIVRFELHGYFLFFIFSYFALFQTLLQYVCKYSYHKNTYIHTHIRILRTRIYSIQCILMIHIIHSQEKEYKCLGNLMSYQMIETFYSSILF